jgi:hypothetical protein
VTGVVTPAVAVKLRAGVLRVRVGEEVTDAVKETAPEGKPLFGSFAVAVTT